MTLQVRKESRCGLKSGILSGRRRSFGDSGGRAGALPSQDTVLAHRWGSRTQRNLFGDQLLQLPLLSTSCMLVKC